MRYEAEGIQYTESEFREIACMECLTEFSEAFEAEAHVKENPGHSVVMSTVFETEIVGI